MKMELSRYQILGYSRDIFKKLNSLNVSLQKIVELEVSFQKNKYEYML